MVPERHNNVKVLILLDVGGSMDDRIKRVEELFSAAKAEFKHLEFYYFHNCVYKPLWKDNRRRHTERTPTFDVLHQFKPDSKLIFVGDAITSPYEVLQPGGSVEYKLPKRARCGCAGSRVNFRITRGSIRSQSGCGSIGSRSARSAIFSATACTG